jgi:ATP-dependent protease ClpP protease subunit
MSNQNKWYEIKAQAGVAGEASPRAAAEIFIYGDIGPSWYDDTVTAASLCKELTELNADTITVRINSFGGSVPDGLAIYNALKRHRASVDVQIDGVAMSIAGYIAMAGDTITMADNAILMIHAPWTCVGGNAADFREAADVLDKWAAAMATSYAAKSGKAVDECMALLTDGKDHYYTAAEAQAEGWCDAVGPALEVSASMAKTFDMSRFKQVPAASATIPAAAAVQPQEKTMPDPVVTPAAQPAAAAPAAAPFARTKEMYAEVLAIFKPFAAKAGVLDLQTEILADPSITVDAAQAKLLNKLGQDVEPVAKGGPVIVTTQDERDTFRALTANAILARAGAADVKADAANPYRGHTLVDIARASLEKAGIKTNGMDRMDIVAAAFTQSTSDFPILLENAMHKTLQAAYAKAALTWQRFCSRGTVSDFRAHNRYRVGSLGNLQTVNELGEFKNSTIPDGEKSSITAATKGNIINLSRQTIINDDLGAFIGLAGSLGWAAARTVETDVYALLAQNAGLGPTMADTYTLFHANHGNIGAAGVLSSALVDDMRVKMGSQTGVGGVDILDLRPSVILVPLASGSTARVINNAEYDPDTANKLQRPNAVRGLYRDIVDTARLSGTRVYTFADPSEAPVIEVAFLDGQDTPYLEQQMGFTVDGTSFKARLDFGIAAIDYRGAVTAAGA